MACIHIYSFIAFMLLISTGLNTPVPSSQNTTAPFTLYPRCTTDDRWKLPGDPNAGAYVPACQLALFSLTSQQIHGPAAMRRRFVAARAGGHFIGLLVRTPQRYIYQYNQKSCTVVVAMLSDFEPYVSTLLPAPPPGPFTKTFVASWAQVYMVADVLFRQCLRGTQNFGYATLEYNKLGVFFWATGSYMEGTLPLGPWLGANLSILETD